MFHPNTVEIQGVPGQIYSRAPQFRLSHLFKTDVVEVEVAAAASRPPQRDAEIPDAQGGLRLALPMWKGIHTAGSTGTAIDALSVGVSGAYRRFAVMDFSAMPSARRVKDGWGVSVDALIPVVPMASLTDNTLALTVTGSFVTGQGINDLYTGLTGGVSFPSLPMMATFTPNIDNGLVTYDAMGNLHSIKWQSYIAGAQLYFPTATRFWISGNYSHMKSDNIASYGASTSKVFNKSMWADGNIFYDVNNAVRFGVEYAYFQQTYADDKKAHNHRVQLSGFYIF
jgi:hypothetical protein